MMPNKNTDPLNKHRIVSNERCDLCIYTPSHARSRDVFLLRPIDSCLIQSN